MCVFQLSAQNQELMEQSVCLRERLQTESSVCDVELTQQLLNEMASCLTDLRSLCSVLTHTAHGRDPNLSLLLGISGENTRTLSNYSCYYGNRMLNKIIHMF